MTKRIVSFIKNYLRYMRLSTKLLLLNVISVFLPLSVTLLLFNKYSSNALAKRSFEAADSSFSQIYSIFEEQFEVVRQNVLLLLLDDTARNLLQDVPYNFNIIEQRKSKDAVAMTLDHIEKLTDPMSLHIYIRDDYTYLVDYQHYFPFCVAENAVWFHQLCSEPYRNLWISAEESSGDNTAFVSVRPVHHETLAYAVRVCDPENYNKTVSILKMEIPLDYVTDILRGSLTLNGSSAYLLDKSNHIIASASLDQEMILPEMKLLPSYLQTKHETVHINNKDYYVIYRAFKGHPWVLATVIPLKSINTLLKDTQLMTVFVLAIFMALAIFLFILSFSNHITRRIYAVSENMRNLKKGEIHALRPSNSKDEIGDLIDSYNYMTYELKLLIENEYLSGVNRKNAEFMALQAQINPHFLYNTLELINYYAYQSDPKSVDQVVSLLSKFYKLSLNKGDNVFCIWQELELVDTYFSIRNMRHGNTLNLVIDIPAELLQYKIPKITLQPLVENAIQHGICMKENKKGTVTITGKKTDDNIMITVSDDGAGLDPVVMEKLNHAETLLTSLTGSNHYGIWNINERIKTFFGSQYGLLFESTPGAGTTVTLIMPAR